MARAAEICMYRLLRLTSRTFGKKTARAGMDKILISRADSIGDFILFSSCLAEFRKLYGKAYIVLLVQDIAFELAETCPYVDEVWRINHWEFRRNIFEHVRWHRRMASAGFDMAVNAVYSTSFAFLECLIGWTGAPRRIAFTCSETERKRDNKDPFYTEFVPEQQGIVFEMERNFQLLRYLGATRPFSANAEIWLRDEDMLSAQRIREKMDGKPYAVLFPGAAKQMRLWGAENFVKVIDGLAGEFPMHWLICGGDREDDLCKAISERLRDLCISAENLAGKTTLRELYGIIRGAAFYLGSESMAAHLAAAAHIPSVTIMGGAYYGRFYPYPDNPLTVAAAHELPCWGCNWSCLFDESKCITSVSVADVGRAAKELLGTRRCL